jgi:hypothetical protein
VRKGKGKAPAKLKRARTKVSLLPVPSEEPAAQLFPTDDSYSSDEADSSSAKPKAVRKTKSIKQHTRNRFDAIFQAVKGQDPMDSFEELMIYYEVLEVV